MHPPAAGGAVGSRAGSPDRSRARYSSARSGLSRARPNDAEQVGHPGHLLDLLLEKPLQELLALKVAFLSGKNSERPDLPADLALLLECEVYRGDDVVEAGARGRRPRDDGFGTRVE